MKGRGRSVGDAAGEAQALLDEILADAGGDDEQLRALRHAFEEGVPLPADAFVIGEPVSVVAIDYDGNARRGLTATCRRADRSLHTVAACDVVFAAEADADGARHVAAYRMWLGLPPVVTPARHDPGRPRRHKAADEDLDLGAPLELVALAVKQSAARCRILGTGREVTLRSRDVWRVVPGEILTVHGRKQWRYAGHPYLSGDVEDTRLDVAALGLTPLRLEEQWTWDPAKEYWGEEGEPLEAWARPIVARGPRPSFEMEQVLPGADPDDPDADPILRASELQAEGDPLGADKLLMELLAADLRCLDAHAHLGNFAFDHGGAEAVRHYEVGVRIGELSLGEGFEGVLPWGRVDNRPFLRCLHGWGLCLWRLDRHDEAAAVFERMLWLNPTDNQGIRFLFAEVRAGERWEDRDSKR
jgi:hypothetical protein